MAGNGDTKSVQTVKDKGTLQFSCSSNGKLASVDGSQTFLPKKYVIVQHYYINTTLRPFDVLIRGIQPNLSSYLAPNHKYYSTQLECYSPQKLRRCNNRAM